MELYSAFHIHNLNMRSVHGSLLISTLQNLGRSRICDFVGFLFSFEHCFN